MPGKCGAVFASDVQDTLSVLEDAATSTDKACRVVTLTWTEVPPLANELGLLVDALARAVPDFFPDLYGLAQGTGSPRWSKAQIETEAHVITREVPGVDGSACRRILKACYEGGVPSLGKLHRAAQARQLALAKEPSRLVVLVAVSTAPTATDCLLSLAQGVEWLAANTRSRVAIVLSQQFAGRKELDHVTYGAALSSNMAVERPRTVSLGATDMLIENPSTPRSAAPEGPAKPVVGVSPIIGRPAKNSEAEQALFAALTEDDALKSLFAFNQPVRTIAGTQPVVDLLWREGRVAIEIDGHDHRGEMKYSKDRERDLELTLSGYRVIRFTTGHVILRLPWVVERIRDAVRFVRNGVPS
jgi:very-short-patch-repair endonuclease